MPVGRVTFVSLSDVMASTRVAQGILHIQFNRVISTTTPSPTPHPHPPSSSRLHHLHFNSTYCTSIDFGCCQVVFVRVPTTKFRCSSITIVAVIGCLDGRMSIECR